MNTLEMCNILSPSAIEEECAKFTIDEVLSPFVLHNIAKIGERYTLSLWVKSESEGSIVARGATLPTTTEWSKYSVTFAAKTTNINIFFNSNDVYYIYHPQLETGNKATDWDRAPEDVDEEVSQAQSTADDANDMAKDAAGRIDAAESELRILKDSIVSLVRDMNGTSMMQQDETGWHFSMADTLQTVEDMQNSLTDLDGLMGSTSALVEVLNESIEDIRTNGIEWVKVTTFEDEPCIALGKTDSEFKLLITNTRIMFMDGSDVPAYITNKTLNITKAVIQEEMHVGGFVVKTRDNGNVGWLWKGVNS